MRAGVVVLLGEEEVHHNWDLSWTERGAMYSIAVAHLALCQALLDELHIGKAYWPVHSKN